MNTIKRITIVGAGCVGTFFATEFFQKGFTIVEIISRKKFTAIHLANQLGAKALYDDFSTFDTSADLYILSVKDEAIMELRNKFIVKDKIIVHTSGSITQDVFKKSSSNYGVLYPLQTIIKGYNPDIGKIPFFINASNKKTLDALTEFAKCFSNTVIKLNDDQRIKLHMAAVFASNFSNYLLKISEDILAKEKLSLSILKPLVEENIKRAFDIGPRESQTGPAKRGDCNITDKHISLLVDQNLKTLYQLFSDMIREEYKETK